MGTETILERLISLELGLINTGSILWQLTALLNLLIVTGTLKGIFFYFPKDKKRFVSINKTIQFMKNESIKEEKSQITHACILMYYYNIICFTFLFLKDQGVVNNLSTQSVYRIGI
jgi:hypothetical protein